MITMIQTYLAAWGVAPIFAQSLAALVVVVSLMVLFVLLDRAVVHSLSRVVQGLLARSYKPWQHFFEKNKAISWLGHMVPVLIAHLILPSLAAWGVQSAAIDLIKLLLNITMVFVITALIFSVLDTLQQAYNRLEISQRRPVKSYLQLLKLVLLSLAALLVVALLLGQSLWSLLAGISAMTAVLMFVFKETLLGLIASIELAVHDIVRIGDWIEVPSQKIDGDVMDMTLTTVKVKNFDKTFSTVPIQALVSSSVKNWRGMYQAGVRRIKRSIYLDVNDVHFMDIKKLAKIKKSSPELASVIDRCIEKEAKVTNSDLLIAYIEQYLKSHPDITDKGFTLLVRALEPSDSGLPVQLYCFTNTTDWRSYEAIQSKIFNHLLAILPLFELKPYQRSSDYKKESLVTT